MWNIINKRNIFVCACFSCSWTLDGVVKRDETKLEGMCHKRGNTAKMKQIGRKDLLEGQ